MREQMPLQYFSYNSEIRSLRIKLGAYYMILLLDIIWSSFIETTTKVNTTIVEITPSASWMSIIHIILVVLVFVIFCTLLWQTQPLKLGLVGILIKDFKWIFLTSLVMIILCAIERIIRLAAYGNNPLTYNTDVQNEPLYEAFFYLRYLFQPLYFVVMINGSLNVVKPHYHMKNPSLWLV